MRFSLFSLLFSRLQIKVVAFLYRGSHINAYVLLNLSNELGKTIKCEAFNKLNNTRAHMLDSIYHMTLRLL